MTLVKRRPTPEQAEHLLKARLSNEAQIRKYHMRRAAGVCVTCEEPSNGQAYCLACTEFLSAQRKARAA